MSKLYFYFSSMGAGKSAHLLQAAYNYKERKMTPIIFNAVIDKRFGQNEIVSRTGLREKSGGYTPETDFREAYGILVRNLERIDCIMIDEAQFLTPEQVEQLAEIVDYADVPVLCYGLKNDFQSKLFPGSKRLLELADKLVEIKTVCHCGSHALFVLRLDKEGQVVTEGKQIEIGGNESYIAVCRKHWGKKEPGEPISKPVKYLS